MTKVHFVILTMALIVTFNELRMCHILLFFQKMCHSHHLVEFSSGRRTRFSVTGGVDQRERNVGIDFIVTR